MISENDIHIKVKDHSVSGEVFTLKRDSIYDYLITSPQPSLEQLPNYYKSEDYISHTNSKRNIFEAVYHMVRKVSISKKVNLINSQFTEDKKILDIGCGTGDFLHAVKKEDWNVVGIEPNESARQIAISKVGKDIYDTDHLMSLPSDTFDIITLWHVLEHLPKLEEHIQLIKSLLKENGTLIVAVPNYNSFDANHYKQFWAAYDVPRHLWHFSRKAIQTLFGTVQLNVEKELPMKFDSYYVSLLSEKYKSGFMNPFKAFWIGLKSNLKANRTKEYSSIIYILKNQ